MEVRDLVDEDAGWVKRVLRDETAGPAMVSRGRRHDGLSLPGVVALHGGARTGVALFSIADGHAGDCELVFVAATQSGIGAGRALLDAVVERAALAGCRRVWLVTTNDNTHAIRFYQRCGWDLVALHHDAVERSRALKPSIPVIGKDGIPIRHELEFERRIASTGDSGGLA